jgi:hypothetical protein
VSGGAGASASARKQVSVASKVSAGLRVTAVSAAGRPPAAYVAREGFIAGADDGFDTQPSTDGYIEPTLTGHISD